MRNVVVLFTALSAVALSEPTYAIECESQINRKLASFGFGTFNKVNSGVVKDVEGENGFKFTRNSDRNKVGSFNWQGPETVVVKKLTEGGMEISLSDTSMLMSLGEKKTVKLASDCSIERILVGYGGMDLTAEITPELCQRYYYKELPQPAGNRTENMAKEGRFEDCEGLIGIVTHFCTAVYANDFKKKTASSGGAAAPAGAASGAVAR